MKKSLIISVIAAAVAVGVLSFNQPAKAQQHRRLQNHQVVFAWAYPYAIGATYDGALVYASSSSQGAPTFPQEGGENPPMQLADVVAKLLDEGFNVRVNEDCFSVYATKP